MAIFDEEKQNKQLEDLHRQEEEELVAMSKKGQVIRTALKAIPLLGRQTQGVTIMRLRAGDGIASLACI